MNSTRSLKRMVVAAYRERLELRASSSAACPYTRSPRLSLSNSNPPSYLPISTGGLEVAVVGFLLEIANAEI